MEVKEEPGGQDWIQVGLVLVLVGLVLVLVGLMLVLVLKLVKMIMVIKSWLWEPKYFGLTWWEMEGSRR